MKTESQLWVVLTSPPVYIEKKRKEVEQKNEDCQRYNAEEHKEILY